MSPAQRTAEHLRRLAATTPAAHVGALLRAAVADEPEQSRPDLVAALAATVTHPRSPR